MSVGDLNALTAIGRRGEEPNARAREDPPQGRKPDGENGWAAFNPSRFEHNVFSVIGGIAIRPSTAAAPTDALGTARLRSGRGARRPKRRADDAARERKLAGGIESVSKPKRYVRRFVRPSLQQPDLDAGGRERGPSRQESSPSSRRPIPWVRRPKRLNAFLPFTVRSTRVALAWNCTRTQRATISSTAAALVTQCTRFCDDCR